MDISCILAGCLQLIFLFTPRSRGSTHRSVASPEGRPDSTCVRDGNILACRCFILLLIASCKGANWVMEQPGTSLMEYLPCFQALMGLVSVRKLVVSLADYGSPTVKRTILYSSTWSRWQRFPRVAPRCNRWVCVCRCPSLWGRLNDLSI